MKGKNMAMLILGKKKPPDSKEDSEQGDGEFNEAAYEFFDYLEKGDKKGAAMALKDAIKICLDKEY